MTAENAAANAAAELARGEETLRAAELLLAEELIADAVSRAYYAAFHGARALLVSIGVQPRSHRGTLNLLNLHFVRTGKLAGLHLAALARAQYDRTVADYGAAARFEAQEAREEIDSARALLDAVRSLLFPSQRPV